MVHSKVKTSYNKVCPGYWILKICYSTLLMFWACHNFNASIYKWVPRLGRTSAGSGPCGLTRAVYERSQKRAPKWSGLFGASSRSMVRWRLSLALKRTRKLVPKWDTVRKWKLRSRVDESSILKDGGIKKQGPTSVPQNRLVLNCCCAGLKASYVC